MADIAVLEDQPMARPAFTGAFGDNVDFFNGTGPLRAALERGARWDVAFVDFDLGESKPTGLTALLDLYRLSPQTRVVVSTAPEENGRTLFTLAARHWFNAWGLLNKDDADTSTLRGAIRGVNPTPYAWQAKLTQHAPKIDTLFQRPNWAELWRRWPEFGGSKGVAKELLQQSWATAHTLNRFVDEGHPAMRDLSRALFAGGLRSDEAVAARTNDKPGVEMVGFAQANSHFFRAPDLEAVLRQAGPLGRDRN